MTNAQWPKNSSLTIDERVFAGFLAIFLPSPNWIQTPLCYDNLGIARIVYLMAS
jgi:hypothetical protein